MIMKRIADAVCLLGAYWLTYCTLIIYFWCMGYV